MIARHYKWALNQIFHRFNYTAAIIVEGNGHTYMKWGVAGAGGCDCDAWLLFVLVLFLIINDHILNVFTYCYILLLYLNYIIDAEV